jgi:4-amino-4-deoxy-L-arabinose transferase-like glycosyltransferase
MASALISDFLRGLNPSWLLTDAQHLANFLMFLLGLFFFYRIALRLFPQGVAQFTTALLATQPVFYGHAFINQKDIPLMAFFLACVELGWMAVETRDSTVLPEPGGEGWRMDLRRQWRELSKAKRILIFGGGLLALAVLLDLWWFEGLRGVARTLLGEVYSGRGPEFLVESFGRIAEDAYKTPLVAYQEKLDEFFNQGRVVVSLFIFASALALWGVLTSASFSGVARGWLAFQRAGRTGTLQWPALLAAGIALGLTTSTRMVAPLAGLLVAAYWVAWSGRRAIPALAAYAVVALLAMYLTWPALWGDPLLPFTQSGSNLSRFGSHEVLFWSKLHNSGDLPWQYAPTLLAVQLTLPAVFLFILGVPYSWRLTARDGDRRLIVVLIWIWLVAPIAAAVQGWVPIYNNFRHLLFGLPPAFLIMGYGARILFSIARRPLLRMGLVVAALAPGIVGIVRLHPYEYIYYNEIVGGVRGAEGVFDLDYWCTALREAMVEVNRVASPGDRILVGLVRTAEPFVRPDLQLIPRTGDGPEPAFVLECRRDVAKPSFFTDMAISYEVRSDGALLAIVRAAVPDR